jgi:uncharacterized membrane protein
MLVHFPIALLVAGVALDWLGYWLQRVNLTRAGFYLLLLGTAAAGVAALAGPDHASGDAVTRALLADHQTFALLTVTLAVALLLTRFFAVGGLGRWTALAYLAGTLALLVFVSLTGYFGGELTYHHGVGVVTSRGADALATGDDMRAFLPAKPLIALLGLVTAAVLGGWLVAGRAIAPAYARRWWQALRMERGGQGRLWTLWRGHEATQSAHAQHSAAPYRAS